VGSTLWEKKEQGKPLSFYLSPEITLATPTTVTHRPSFFLSLLRYRDYIGTRKRFLFIGTHFQRQRFLTFFSIWKNIEGSCPLFYLWFFRIYLFLLYTFPFVFLGPFGFPIAWSTIHRHYRVRSNLISFFSPFSPLVVSWGTLCLRCCGMLSLFPLFLFMFFFGSFKKGCIFCSFYFFLPRPFYFLLFFFFFLTFLFLFSASSSTRRRSSVAMAPIESDLINL
jgi:hypothetical protein